MRDMSVIQPQAITTAAEVWRVDAGADLVCLDSGAYTGAEALGHSRSGLTLRSGEGLAGSVLARRLPVLLNDLDESVFESYDAARGCGVRAALGLPLFDGDSLSAITVLFFRGGPGMVGGVELWSGASGRFELRLNQAYYTGLDRFGAVSRYVNFPMGSGLPGLVWQTALPRLDADLGHSIDFLRSTGAESAGLSAAFGYPVIHHNELKAVMLLLSSSDTPLASVHEVWVTQPHYAGSIRKTCGDYRLTMAVPTDTGGTSPSPAVDRCARTRLPVVFDDATALDLPRDAGPVHGGIALPVLTHDVVRAVGVLAW